MQHRQCGLVLVVITLVGVVAASPIHEQGSTIETVDYRLPTGIQPQAYIICLVPYLEDEGLKSFTFDGSVNIQVLVNEPTSVITLHVLDLTIAYERTEVVDVDVNSKMGIHNHTYDPLRHFLHIHLTTMLEINKTYEIHMQFNGTLNDEMNGFYRSSYKEESGTKWMATTQFQPTSARKAFPCFDEPAMKATFILNIARTLQPGVHILSNMPLLETSPLDAQVGYRVWDTFQQTVPMSTYLVAFIVSEFTNLTEGTFSVWARQGATEQAAYSMDVGPQALAILEEYTGIDYALPKLDNVAISDFSAGAMENWGLITYRETSLLYDPLESTESNKQRVATVVAHEISHMWFGDLVTPAWWEFTWLSEGFARYLQYVTVDKIHSDWRILEQFVVDQMQPILRTDTLATSPPLSNPCGSPGEVMAMWGSLTYGKGGSVLRMLNHVLTDDTFIRGLHNYLINNEYSSVVPDYLFAELDAVASADCVLPSDVTVKAVMDSWTLVPGYPYIKVVRNLEDNKIDIHQERFLLTSDPLNPNTTLWWVPLSWTTKQETTSGSSAFQATTAQEWLRGVKTITLDATGIDRNDWVIFNNQQTGYYRVAYDAPNWKLILDSLQSVDYERVHVLNRAQIIDDALNLARGAVVDYNDALDATLYLRQEVDHIAWVAAFNGFAYLDSRLVTSDGFDAFKRYVLLSLNKLYETVTFTEGQTETQTTILSRVNALTWACKYGHASCVGNAKNEFSEYMAVSKRVSPNKKSVVYCTALREGGSTEWEYLWAQYMASNLATEQVLILSALGCTDDVVTLNRYLMMSIDDDSGIRKQDAPSVFSSVYNNPVGVDPAFNFLISHFEEIEAHYVGMNALANAITGVAGKLTTEEQVEQLRVFLAENEAALGESASSAGAKAIEAAEEDLEWANKYATTILDWMTVNTGGAAPQTVATPLVALIVATLLHVGRLM